MTTVDFSMKAIERAQNAIKLDQDAMEIKDDPDRQRKKYNEAWAAYMSSFEAFEVAIKWEKVPAHKQKLKEKFLEYMTRAELIKSLLNEPVKKKKAAADGDDKGDKDKNKMKDAIMEAIVCEKPNIKWSDIAGLESAKEALKEAVILPIKFPQLFQGGGRKPWTGIMLYGPPGTGKSFLAKAVATEADATFYSVSSADLTSKWLGESEKLVKTLFTVARENKPAIIFIDEIDSIASSRSDSESESSRRIKTEFLVQMEGVGNSLDGVLILCATNLPWMIDSAVRRRCQKRIYIPLPDFPARKRMFEINIDKISPKPDVSEEQLALLANKTEGYSGSDIAVLCRDAVMEPVRRCQDAQEFQEVEVEDDEGNKLKKLMPCAPGTKGGIKMTLMQLAETRGPEMLIAPPVNYRDFDKTLLRCKPSVSEGDLQEFQDFTNNYGQEG